MLINIKDKIQDINRYIVQILKVIYINRYIVQILKSHKTNIWRVLILNDWIFLFRYTPESRKSLMRANSEDTSSTSSPRKRMESSSSTDWASMVDDYEMDMQRARQDLARYKRKLQMGPFG